MVVKDVSSQASDEKSITISFARSASPSFSIARKRLDSLAEHGKLTIEKDDQGREAWFSLTIGPGKLVELARRISNLARMIRGWKSTEFCIGDEPVKPIDFETLMHRFEEVDRCRREKMRKESKPCAIACHLGCDQLSIKPSHPCLDSFQSKQLWWTVGNFNGKKVTLNKERLLREIAEPRNEPFQMCPNYNSEAVAKKIAALPDIISAETEGWKVVCRREDGSPVWIWPIGQLLPFGLYEKKSEKAIERTSAKEHGRTYDLPKRNVPRVTYADVCGQEEAVEAVRDMVELPLTHAALFAQVGVRDAGGGIILAGPPGTGKTLLAKAVAGESKAHIEIVAGPELLSKWFGESERRLRTIFQRARELQPSVILFDELDGIAGSRNGDSCQRTFVAQLLTLLDGLEDRGRVFAIATTNRPHDIDPALRRPGRFDRVIYMDLPNESGRKSLFDHHIKPMKLSPDFDATRLAASTPGLSGAQIAYTCRRAGVLCIKEAIKKGTANQDVLIKMEHFLQAIAEIRPAAIARPNDLNQSRRQRPIKELACFSTASAPRV
jgi:AAA+ superfamily predicted ATPase